MSGVGHSKEKIRRHRLKDARAFAKTVAEKLPLNFGNLIKIPSLSDGIVKDIRLLQVVCLACTQAIEIFFFCFVVVCNRKGRNAGQPTCSGDIIHPDFPDANTNWFTPKNQNTHKQKQVVRGDFFSFGDRLFVPKCTKKKLPGLTSSGNTIGRSLRQFLQLPSASDHSCFPTQI